MFKDYFKRNSRFTSSPAGQINAEIKSLFKIDEEEQILLVIDDGFFLRRKRIVVLTNKGLYWNSPQALLRRLNNETMSVTHGKGFVSNKLLAKCSVYAGDSGQESVVSLISNSARLHLPFRNCKNVDALRIIFYDYLSNYSGGYRPEDDTNAVIYKKELKEYKKANIRILDRLAQYVSLSLWGLLLLNDILEARLFDFSMFLNLFAASLLIRLSQLSSRGRPSYLTNLVLLTASAYLVFAQPAFSINYSILLAVLIVFSLLFTVFDFDKILAVLVQAASLIALLYVFRFLFGLPVIGR